MNNNNNIDTNELNTILDRTIGFIRTCDTKASIILATIGVIATICFSNDLILAVHDLIHEMNIIILIVFGLAILAVSAGVACLIAVLFARAKVSKSKSVIYFKDIYELYDGNSYILRLHNCTYDELFEDYAKQIYINAEICSKKYKYYNKGLILSFFGIFALIILLSLAI